MRRIWREWLAPFCAVMLIVLPNDAHGAWRHVPIIIGWWCVFNMTDDWAKR